MKHAYATGTWNNWKTQQRLYEGFCEYFSIDALPASSDILCRFAEFLARKFQDPESVRSYINGVKILHIWHGYETVQFEHKSLDWMLKGIARQKKHVPKQALPIELEMLRKIRMNLNMETQADKTYWVLFLLAFYLMARKSNLVPDKESNFDTEKQLIRGDITVTDRALLVKIKWSKTLQFGKREHMVPIWKMSNIALCPVKAYTDMIDCTPGSTTQSVFRVKK